MKTEQRTGRSRKLGGLAAFVAVLVAAVLVAGCAGGDQAAQSQPAEEERTAQELTVENETTDETSAEEREAGVTARGGEDAQDDGNQALAGEVVLRIGGGSGTTFSGTCAAGDETAEVSGEVPQTFTYRLDGGQLECEIENTSGGSLKLVLESGNNRSVHRTNGAGAVINLTYSGNGVSSSVTNSSGSVSQQSTSSGSSSSVIVSNSSSSSSVIQQNSSSSQGSR